jgi:alanine transaminase
MLRLSRSFLSPLQIQRLNPAVRDAEYAVRGELVARALQLSKSLKEGAKLPFDKVVFCNIGNPQSLGQQPITYFRQV